MKKLLYLLFFLTFYETVLANCFQNKNYSNSDYVSYPEPLWICDKQKLIEHHSQYAKVFDKFIALYCT